jgi:hypothetical protein
MRDQHDDLVFQAFRHQLGDDVARLVKSVAYAFERLTARLYDAPWLKQPRAGRECGNKQATIV